MAPKTRQLSSSSSSGSSRKKSASSPNASGGHHSPSERVMAGPPGYEGQLDSNGLPDGTGTQRFEKNAYYEGQFLHGQRHGRGVLQFANGDRYVGTFDHDSREGEGKYQFQCGASYEGEWKRDARHGRGVLALTREASQNMWRPMNPPRFKRTDLPADFGSDGAQIAKTLCNVRAVMVRYEGDFADNLFHGHGKVFYESGAKYEGAFNQSVEHGPGVLELPSGDKIEGSWKMGNLHGTARITSAKTGIPHTTEFHQGMLKSTTALMQSLFKLEQQGLKGSGSSVSSQQTQTSADYVALEEERQLAREDEEAVLHVLGVNPSQVQMWPTTFTLNKTATAKKAPIKSPTKTEEEDRQEKEQQRKAAAAAEEEQRIQRAKAAEAEQKEVERREKAAAARREREREKEEQQRKDEDARRQQQQAANDNDRDISPLGDGRKTSSNSNASGVEDEKAEGSQTSAKQQQQQQQQSPTVTRLHQQQVASRQRADLLEQITLLAKSRLQEVRCGFGMSVADCEVCSPLSRGVWAALHPDGGGGGNSDDGAAPLLRPTVVRVLEVAPGSVAETHLGIHRSDFVLTIERRRIKCAMDMMSLKFTPGQKVCVSVCKRSDPNAAAATCDDSKLTAATADGHTHIAPPDEIQRRTVASFDVPIGCNFRKKDFELLETLADVSQRDRLTGRSVRDLTALISHLETQVERLPFCIAW